MVGSTTLVPWEPQRLRNRTCRPGRRVHSWGTVTIQHSAVASVFVSTGWVLIHLPKSGALGRARPLTALPPGFSIRPAAYLSQAVVS